MRAVNVCLSTIVLCAMTGAVLVVAVVDRQLHDGMTVKFVGGCVGAVLGAGAGLLLSPIAVIINAWQQCHKAALREK